MPAVEAANAACRLSAAAPRPAVLTRGAEPPGTPTTLGCRQRSAPRNPHNLVLPLAVSAPEPPQPCVAVGGQHPGPPDLHNLGLLTAVSVRAPGPPQPWVADGGQRPGPGTPTGWLSRRARLSRHGLLLVRDEPPRAPHPVAGPAARVLQGPDRAGLLDPAARAVPGAVRRAVPRQRRAQADRRRNRGCQPAQPYRRPAGPVRHPDRVPHRRQEGGGP